MPTIAIIGAGPGMGLAIARTFGSRGFDIALIARTKEKLETLVDQLGQEGITAEAFPADVLDRPSLIAALDAAKARFGGIDVLEYSPAPHSPVPGLTMAAPSEVTVDNLQPQIEYNFYGAVAATRTVLPAMREAGAGTLLFTTGGGSVNPVVPMLANVNAAAAALRNWAINLHNELAGTGVHAAHVAINVWIGDGGPEGIPTATPEQIAPLYWDLHENRDRSEAVFNA
ncbi:SDR family NAD(P)-dependent oxidoreductase [Streptomyces himalayensis]|uniref:SDR family NAD(P)-dependent oxidoreductase n=1 Tax=Streptomyces himalayensis subsp. himalayensis TaxID=2756131 RepID=A0A7W0DVE9_9ACTN|nr:SDR family NAD(P)-dependent oxidoreductase [Streptomyces himalayensis]MBA2951952.1 SDR family NAD(P)-dependent oxidoreductase [Streptomyces himalayensis subsp. himalayensis]